MFWLNCKSSRLVSLFLFFSLFFFDSVKLLHSDRDLFGIFTEMQLTGGGHDASLRSESISNILRGRQINRLSSTCLCATRGKKVV